MTRNQLLQLAEQMEKQARALDDLQDWIAENPEWAAALLGGALGGGFGALNPHPGGGLSLGNILLGTLLGGGIGYGAGHLGRDQIRDWFSKGVTAGPPLDLNPEPSPVGTIPQAKAAPSVDASPSLAPRTNESYPAPGPLPDSVVNGKTPNVPQADPSVVAGKQMDPNPPGMLDPSGKDSDVNNAIPRDIHGVETPPPSQPEVNIPSSKQVGTLGSDLTFTLDPQQSSGKIDVESPVDKLWTVPPSSTNKPTRKGDIVPPRAVNSNAERKINILPGKSHGNPTTQPVNSDPTRQAQDEHNKDDARAKIRPEDDPALQAAMNDPYVHVKELPNGGIEIINGKGEVIRTLTPKETAAWNHYENLKPTEPPVSIPLNNNRLQMRPMPPRPTSVAQKIKKIVVKAFSDIGNMDKPNESLDDISRAKASIVSRPF